MDTAAVVTESVGLNLLPTTEMIKLAGMKLYEFHYVQRKNKAILIPAAVVGRYQFWTGQQVELIKSLRAQIHPQRKSVSKPRKGTRAAK